MYKNIEKYIQKIILDITFKKSIQNKLKVIIDIITHTIA
jgi:hypothetical protein